MPDGAPASDPESSDSLDVATLELVVSVDPDVVFAVTVAFGSAVVSPDLTIVSACARVVEAANSIAAVTAPAL